MSTDPKKTLQDRIARIEKRREQLFALKEPIDKELHATYNRLRKAQGALGELEIQEMQASGVIDWRLLLDATGDNSATYKQLNVELAKYEAGNMGYSSKTNQRIIQLSLIKKDDERTALARQLIEAVAPSLVAVDGYVSFGIMERTLSEHGCYVLLMKPDLSAAKLEIQRYGWPSDLLNGTLDEVLAYIQKNHYYAKSAN